ncbi:MAG: RNA polymerase sigma factor [Elusimicrobia bacterium]|nr:RNA polymerase sigma factor [Elusimicrobiota bacterium]
MMLPSDQLTAVDAVLAGDTEAFAILVRANKGLVMAVCVSYLGNTPEAEDAAQEAFLKAYAKLSAFRRESAFSTWLCTIARRRCLDLLHQRGASKTQSLDELVEAKGDFIAAPPQEQGLNHRGLADLLDSLPPDYRTVIALRETQNLSYEEIAAAMDCTVDSVKARLRRARKTLMENARHFLPQNLSNEMQGATGNMK